MSHPKGSRRPFILFVTWGRRAYRDASARRTIGILWDVGTFWPRAVHPLAPPCYMERTAPDLLNRMGRRPASGHQRLLLSAHSQGSVIAAAAIMQTEAALLERISLLTYGSPLRRLYATAFPAYFGGEALGRLGQFLRRDGWVADGEYGESRMERAGWRWHNLYRSTDFIGGPLFAEWRAIVGPFFAQPPHVEHFNLVTTA